MKQVYQNILKGVGSIVDIMPSAETSDYSRFVPKGTPEERMVATWERVGASLERAMGKYAEQQKEVSK